MDIACEETARKILTDIREMYFDDDLIRAIYTAFEPSSDEKQFEAVFIKHLKDLLFNFK